MRMTSLVSGAEESSTRHTPTVAAEEGKAMKKMPTGKDPGSDATPAEV